MRAVRSLAFPGKASCGTLFVIGPDRRRRRLAPARGDVAVPNELRLGATITDPDGLTAFDALRPRDLEWLDLHKSAASDQHLQPVARLVGLRELNLSKASLVGDEGLKHLRHLWALRDLDLYRTGVGDHGLIHLRRLHSLERLHLGMTQVRGPGLVHLRGLPSLRWLSLEDTSIGDEALPLLGEIPNLAELVLRGTRVTRTGAAALARLNPVCRVQGDLEHNEWQLHYEKLRREVLAILVRRADPQAPVHRESPSSEIAAALNRLFPSGTHLASLPAAPTATAVESEVTSSGCEADLASARRLNTWLLSLPEGCSIRVTPPGEEPTSSPG